MMRVFREDDRLNVSPAYLRPGFSFGGSCLPKDLRALMHVARVADVDMPMLSGVMRSNESHLRLAARRVLDTGEREVALLGLSFKPETDDLRESPYVELAEILVGKGLDVRIFDPIVQPARLIGANRRYVEDRSPSSPAHALRDAHRGHPEALPSRWSRPPTRRSSARCPRRHRRSCSIFTAGSVPRSRRSPATAGSRGELLAD